MYITLALESYRRRGRNTDNKKRINYVIDESSADEAASEKDGKILARVGRLSYL